MFDQDVFINVVGADLAMIIAALSSFRNKSHKIMTAQRLEEALDYLQKGFKDPLFFDTFKTLPIIYFIYK